MPEKIDIVIADHASLQQSTSSFDEWLKSMMDRKREQTGNYQLGGPIIPRVPSTFRKIENNSGCYDPSVVSIGPYHHGKPELKEMEDNKVTFASQFVMESQVAPDTMFCKVEGVASNARKCYTGDSTQQFEDKEFSQMMFLDGCFILHFFFCLSEQPEKLKMSNHHVSLVARDLFLLENQLPFEVLLELMSLRFNIQGGGRVDLFEPFFKHIRSMPPRRESCREKLSKNLATISSFFRCLLKLFSSTDHPKSPTNELTAIHRKPAHLLELFHNKFVARSIIDDAGVKDHKSWYKDDSRKSWSGRYYPAKDLRKAGIHFKPSKTSLFTDVSFTPTLLAGRLYIPPLRIDDSTKPLLLNLVAYEACLGTRDDWVTSYVCFMDSLIDHHKDVKELRSKGILISTLGSDKQVAELFNEISDYLVPNPYAYSKVKRDIENHYRNGIKRWILHYKGPTYTFIFKYSFIFGLIVTAIKAYVSVVPVNPVFGVCKMPAANVTLYP
ncbi:hypothetical protein Peur_044158 [Populus x canadensis]